jgi:hypothetical protein
MKRRWSFGRRGRRFRSNGSSRGPTPISLTVLMSSALPTGTTSAEKLEFLGSKLALVRGQMELRPTVCQGKTLATLLSGSKTDNPQCCSQRQRTLAVCPFAAMTIAPVPVLLERATRFDSSDAAVSNSQISKVCRRNWRRIRYQTVKEPIADKPLSVEQPKKG